MKNSRRAQEFCLIDKCPAIVCTKNLFSGTVTCTCGYHSEASLGKCPMRTKSQGRDVTVRLRNHVSFNSLPKFFTYIHQISVFRLSQCWLRSIANHLKTFLFRSLSPLTRQYHQLAMARLYFRSLSPFRSQ